MKFAYWPLDVEPPNSRTGSVRIYRPLVPIHLITSQDVAFVWALADTGADETLLPASVARAIGLDFGKSQVTTIEGFGGRELTLAYGTIDLVITDGKHRFQWSTQIGIVEFDKPDHEVTILGHKGGLDYFRATFDGANREVELIPNDAYPGTVI